MRYIKYPVMTTKITAGIQKYILSEALIAGAASKGPTKAPMPCIRTSSAAAPVICSVWSQSLVYATVIE